MKSKECILIVDDNTINRDILREILSRHYDVIEAENGRDALDILKAKAAEISAVLCDLVMPGIDGFQILKEMSADQNLISIPIITMTADVNNKDEVKALRMGAWDFVSKPYNPEVILCRLRNAIGRSQVISAEKLRFLAEHDELTGLYNKNNFYKATEEMLHSNPNEEFVFIYFNIERFQLINTFYGVEEGNNLLRFIGDTIRGLEERYDNTTYGRIDGDVFCLCMENNRELITNTMENTKPLLESYNSTYIYDIEPNFGVYEIKDNFMPVEEIYSNASIAAIEGAGNYLCPYTYYTDEMDANLKKEQDILNDMYHALYNEEFSVYLQPKFNIHNNTIVGAESIVRWIHPKKGRISPEEFIHVFESNGFVTKLDYYMWEKTCQILRGWIDQGKEVIPISVNVSRVNFYSSTLVDKITNLVDKYELPYKLLELEITESAYADNPMAVIKTVAELKEKGFTILMDDFGSAYSSLSILKDITVDILKIDLAFLSDSGKNGRGANIIASIVRMAKWLKMPLIVEGVETRNQVDFLKSVGGDYVQGYYYSEPLELNEFQEFASKTISMDAVNMKAGQYDFDVDLLFESNPKMKMLFGDLLQALVIFEFDGKGYEFVRVNEGYHELFGSDDTAMKLENPIDAIAPQYRKHLLDTFTISVNNNGTAECDVPRLKEDGSLFWINLKLRYLKPIGDKHLVLGLLDDATQRKKIEAELEKYRQTIVGSYKEQSKMLIVDDQKVNRAILKKIFEEQYNIIEAGDGLEAIDKLKENPEVAIILLDIVMPKMNGWEFLEYKRENESIAKIPVVIITAEDKFNEQETASNMDICDYIIKPFVPSIVKKRVNNAMNSAILIHETVKKYDETSQKKWIEEASGFYYIDVAKKKINDDLENEKNVLAAMVLFQIKDFREISDIYKEKYGSTLSVKVGQVVKKLFRDEDISFRLNGDTFAVYIKDFKDVELLESRCKIFIGYGIEVKDKTKSPYGFICNIGIAYAPNHGKDFDSLICFAKKAAEKSSEAGGNISTIYNGEY